MTQADVSKQTVAERVQTLISQVTALVSAELQLATSRQ
jgi:hypothetical protein